ncbi:MAG: O-antigen ligase family protein [Burkholderiaceae bacterium]
MRVSSAAAWAGLLAVLVLAPAVSVFLFDRDVNALDFTLDVGPDSYAASAGRVAVALIALLAALALAYPQRGLSLPKHNRWRAKLLMWSIVFFILGHTVLPASLGAETNINLNILYGPALLIVAYRLGRQSSSAAFATIKWSLLVFLLAGFLVFVFAPQMAMQTEQVPLRVPFIDFRYWGLGSNPNNVAPLALLLVFFVIYQPFKSVVLTVFAVVVGGLTVLFAQSQTTWLAALILLPLFIFYRLIPKPVRKARVHPLFFLGMLTLTSIGLLMLLWELAQVDYDMFTDTVGRLSQGTAGDVGQGSPDDSFLSRIEIWQIALETWEDHPWFGYGPAAWDTAFRVQIGKGYAYSAHNQLMQTVSVGGTVGLLSLLVYLSVLTFLSFKTAEQSHGLTVAILGLIIIRGITETPLDTDTLLSGELFIHVVLVYLLAVFLWRKKPRALRSGSRRLRSRRRRRSSSRAPGTGMQTA